MTGEPREDGDRYCDPTVAARYDFLLADQLDDVRFYVEEAGQESGPVLELGCGTGRVTLPIAEAGVRVVGLDRSPPMLEIAEAKRRAARPDVRSRCAFVRADLRGFAFRRPFAQAFLPFRVFQALLTVPDQLAALASIRAALMPGGRLVFNVLDPRVELLDSEGGPGPLRDTGRVYEAGGDRVRELLTVHLAPVEQRLELTFIYERKTPEGAVERAFEPLRLRYFHRFEIEHLLARAGYEVEALYGDWDRGPFVENGQEMIWVARRT